MELATSASLLLPWAGMVLLGLLLYLTVRQYGQALLRQQEASAQLIRHEQKLNSLQTELADIRKSVQERQVGAEQAAPQLPDGLPLGSPAPDFALPDLAGRTRRLRDYAGRQTLVIFFNPGCGFCQQMAPRLGQLPDGGPRLLVIGQGDADAYRRLTAEHHWRFEVLLDDGGTTAQAYRFAGTPTGYLLDGQGRIASSLAIGADALFRLLPPASEPVAALSADVIPNGHQIANGKHNGHDHQLAGAVGVAHKEAAAPAFVSATEGLPVGTPAPPFSLPDTFGQHRSLAEFGGKQVVLLFVDPECEASRSVAARLGRNAGRLRARDRQLITISRGDSAANRDWGDRYGLPGPVVLQRGWEASKSYATFATPAAYMVDKQGVIADPVAVGPDAVLALVQRGGRR